MLARMLAALFFLVVPALADVLILSTETPRIYAPRTIFSGNEPSGVIWHQNLNTWFIASDDGYVFAVNDAGQLLRTYTVGGDLEAMALHDPTSPYVYIGRERANAILRLNAWTGVVDATWDLMPWLQSADPNMGLEALTSDGTLFYAGLQDTGYVYVFDLATNPATFIRSFSTPLTTISALDYRDGQLVALYDGANLIIWMDTNGVELARATAPDANQEGLAFRGCDLAIANDGGSLRVYEDWLAEGCESVADLDDDGDVDLADYAVFQREMEPQSWR